jgi:hypothetical protein
MQYAKPPQPMIDTETGVEAVSQIGISPRTRSEVFVTDKYTCQYYGRRAPNVLLHTTIIEISYLS